MLTQTQEVLGCFNFFSISATFSSVILSGFYVLHAKKLCIMLH